MPVGTGIFVVVVVAFGFVLFFWVSVPQCRRPEVGDEVYILRQGCVEACWTGSVLFPGLCGAAPTPTCGPESMEGP